jgi:hypothetical protein
MEDKKESIVNVKYIWGKRNEAVIYNNEYPDNVMIHPRNKENLIGESMKVSGFILMESKNQKIFGMKVIWTYEIEENEVICTYNKIKK